MVCESRNFAGGLGTRLSEDILKPKPMVNKTAFQNILAYIK